MPFAITGGRYAASSVSAVGTTTVTVGATPFVQADFTKQRLVGLWTSGGVFKGMSWARRWVSTSQIQLERPFFDPATGETVTQVVGDQILVSKDFAESVTAGLSVSNNIVTITDGASVTFGIDNNSMGVCFYDQGKYISTNASTLLSGGLAVFGKLEDYSTQRVSNSCDFFLTGAGTNFSSGIRTTNASANAAIYGGSIDGNRGNTYYIGGNQSSLGGGVGGRTLIINGVQNAFDFASPNSGGTWGVNASRHQLINCFSETTATNAIMARWGDGPIVGGTYKFPRNTSAPISVFGGEPGIFNIATPAGQRSIVLDMGGGPALFRCGTTNGVVTANYTNLITTDFRSVNGATGGLVANNNGRNILSFSDPYTGLQPGTVGVILNNSGAVADSVASSTTSWSPSLLRRTCVGATVTVNATSWTYGLKRYGFNPVGGTITPTTYDLGAAGTADNVAFGGVVTQLADTGVTLTQAQALAMSSKFTASATGSGTLTVTGNATYDEIYDYLIAWNASSVALAQFPSISAYPITFAGSTLNTGMAIVVNAGVTLSQGVKFRALNTTSTVTNNGTISGTYTDASGTRVTIRTADDLPLSTYLTIDGVPQAWQAGQTARNIFVTPGSVVRIYAHAYGYQPQIINVTGNTASDYVISLLQETNVDTSLDTATRDAIAAAFAVGADAFSRLFLSVNTDLRSYSPAATLNALHYFTVTQGAMIAAAAVAANSVAGFALQRGGFIIRSPGFYGKVADSVTATGALGILVPLAIAVDPSVYVALPSYTPVELNTSGIVLQYAPWTQQEADVNVTAIAGGVWTNPSRTLTSGVASASEVAEAVLQAAQTTPIHADAQRMNGAEIIGAGTEGNAWRGVGVSP